VIGDGSGNQRREQDVDRPAHREGLLAPRRRGHEAVARAWRCEIDPCRRLRWCCPSQVGSQLRQAWNRGKLLRARKALPPVLPARCDVNGFGLEGGAFAPQPLDAGLKAQKIKRLLGGRARDCGIAALIERLGRLRGKFRFTERFSHGRQCADSPCLSPPGRSPHAQGSKPFALVKARHGPETVSAGLPLERYDLSRKHHPALRYWWSMIFSENRYPLFGIMLSLANVAAAIAACDADDPARA
jgi:hypothetical protein